MAAPASVGLPWMENAWPFTSFCSYSFYFIPLLSESSNSSLDMIPMGKVVRGDNSGTSRACVNGHSLPSSCRGLWSLPLGLLPPVDVSSWLWAHSWSNFDQIYVHCSGPEHSRWGCRVLWKHLRGSDPLCLMAQGKAFYGGTAGHWCLQN